MKIDCQSHIFPREYAEVLTRNPHEPRAVSQGDKYLITYGQIQRFDLEPETYRIKPATQHGFFAAGPGRFQDVEYGMDRRHR